MRSSVRTDGSTPAEVLLSRAEPCVCDNEAALLEARARSLGDPSYFTTVCVLLEFRFNQSETTSSAIQRETAAEPTRFLPESRWRVGSGPVNKYKVNNEVLI